MLICLLCRILIEFRTRKAHRWVVRDKDLLKYLLAMVLIAFVYLAGHTATALHTMQERPDALMARGRTLQVGRIQFFFLNFNMEQIFLICLFIRRACHFRRASRCGGSW